MAETIECEGCGAPAPASGVACSYCGAVAPAVAPAVAVPQVDGRNRAGEREAITAGRPRAHEARRIRGLGVPLVAAAIVLAIGFPLTALAVSQVGRLPAPTDLGPAPAGEGVASGTPTTPGAIPSLKGRGQVRLSGAVTYEGAVTPVDCGGGGPPKLATFEAGPQRFSILVNPPEAAPRAYRLEGATSTFVAITRTGGSQTWTSLLQPGAKGVITISPGGGVTAQFSGVAAVGGGAEGTIDGVLELACA